MKIRNIYIIGPALAMLTACNTRLVPSEGQADNAIVLRAGISEGPAGVQTKAGAEEDNHDASENYGGHKNFSASTQLRLRVDGTWLGKADGKAPHGTISSTTVSQITTGTIGDKTGTGDLHNKIDFESSEKLYWDDYGSADPANIDIDDGGSAANGTGGREKGLTIYGAAINGQSAPTVSDWTALSWTLNTDQKTNYWNTKDLLISNNVKDGTGDGTYKFAARASGKLLEFTHAMSKITVRLIASNGFPTTGDGLVGNTTNKFKALPNVTLTSNIGTATTNTEWPFTSGNIDITTGDVTSQAGNNKIVMHPQETPANTYTAIYDALVVPGSCFGDTDAAVIARINADDNIYYLTAKEIRKKMHTDDSSTDYKTESGKEYILTVNVKKTEIEVTATVKDWITVESEEVPPVINVSANWGTTTGASSVDGFSFYRSLSLDNGYSDGFSANANGYFAAEAIATKPGTPTNQWPFVDGSSNLIKLYWPTHNTHYQFRGVWPNTSVLTTDTETEPHVRSESSVQVIVIKNVAYSTTNNYPSNLMIARPEFGLDTDGITPFDPECTNSDHTHKHLYSDGICATEGLITLNFRYVMSQVEVVLSTSDGGSTDHVNIGANTVVEIVNVANDGYVKLGDRTVVPSTTKGNYILDAVSGEGKELKRHSAIVPQTLTFSEAGATTNVRFKITVTNNDAVPYANVEEYNTAKGTSIDADEFAALSDVEKTKTPATQDIYYADIKPILKSDKSGPVAPNGKWESGVHYKYSLKLTKTEVKVTATITDWVTVDAEEDIWF